MKRYRFSTPKVLTQLFLFLVLLSPEIVAQNKEIQPIEAAKEPFQVELKFSKKEKIPVTRFGYMIVRDIRPDKTKLGYVVLDPKKGKPQRVTLEKEGEPFINKLFNDAIQPAGNKDTVLILLNEIWLNETLTEATEAHKLFFGMEKLVSSCFVNADIFLKKDNGYLLLEKLDSIHLKKGEWLPNNCGKLLERSVKMIVKLADTTLSMPLSTENVLSQVQMESFIQSRFQYPILSAQPGKGIFMTYNDFLANKPLDVPFEVISDVHRNIRYAGRAKDDTAWGYSDGTNIYMHIDKGFYLLNKAQNSYDILAPATVEIINSDFLKAASMTSDFLTMRIINPVPYFKPRKYNIEYVKFYRLNLPDGRLY